MSFTEKISILDLLSKKLMEHEKRLDEFVTRLDLLVDQIDDNGLMPNILDGDPSAVDAKVEDVD